MISSLQKTQKQPPPKTLKWKQSKMLGDLALQCFGVTDFTSAFWVTLEDWKGKFSRSSEIAHISAHMFLFCNFAVWRAYRKRMPQLTITFHHPQKPHNPCSEQPPLTNGVLWGKGMVTLKLDHMNRAHQGLPMAHYNQTCSEIVSRCFFSL